MFTPHPGVPFIPDVGGTAPTPALPPRRMAAPGSARGGEAASNGFRRPQSSFRYTFDAPGGPGHDLGKDHHNPQCEQVGEKHKHQWSERYADKEAYVPDDVNAPVSDPVAVWKEFCAEARIQHDGRMQPPVKQEELW